MTKDNIIIVPSGHRINYGQIHLIKAVLYCIASQMCKILATLNELTYSAEKIN